MNAFVLRITPSGKDRVDEALRTKDLIIGWSECQGLLDERLTWEQFRRIVHEVYYRDDKNHAQSGPAAGNIWRFIRDMAIGDLVVVPHGAAFYVAEVAGPARYEPQRVKDDCAYRRAVKWLNGAKPIPRGVARAALQSRMKARQTCVDATDLISEIRDALAVAEKGARPTFDTDLRRKLVDQVKAELRTGRLDNFGFERVVEALLRSLGANDVRIVPRSRDKGADLLATFRLATTFTFTLAVQAKHFQPTPPVGAEVVDQLVKGMDAEDATLGWVVTSGTFSKEAEDRKTKWEKERGFHLALIDGDQLAALIIEGGLKSTSGPTNKDGASA